MGDRKRVGHYDEPGDCDELTFSCYRRMRLLSNDVRRSMLSVSVGRADCRSSSGMAWDEQVDRTGVARMHRRKLEGPRAVGRASRNMVNGRRTSR